MLLTVPASSVGCPLLPSRCNAGAVYAGVRHSWRRARTKAGRPAAGSAATFLHVAPFTGGGTLAHFERDMPAQTFEAAAQPHGLDSIDSFHESTPDARLPVRGRGRQVWY